MDIQQYIATGIIEAYVLGIASDEEVRELELLSAQYPEIQTALRDCNNDMEQFASSFSVPPPESMKEQIWDKLSANENAVANHEPNHTPLPIVAPSSKSFAFGDVLKIAASLLLLISLGYNWYQFDFNKKNKETIVALQQQQSQNQQDKTTITQQLQSAQDNIALLSNPAAKQLTLADVGKKLGGEALLVWNKSTNEVYLTIKNMPALPKDKQYQLWAIVDGKPVDAGVYDGVQSIAFQKMKAIPKAQMFAITIEKAGGSAQPTLTQMVLAAKV